MEYKLGDATESVIFSPYSDNTVSLGNGLNPNWNSETDGFISSGKTMINLARLDIGGGQVTFFLDGELRNVLSADGNDGNGINANSIFFIDEQFLKKPVLITRDLETEINNNSLTADDLEITEQEFSFIRTLFHNNNTVDNETMIDVNGALCLPLSPVDITSFDPENNTLRIKILWDIADAIHLRDDEYFMDNRVKNTAFDFTVAITIE